MLKTACTYNGGVIDDQCAVRFGIALRSAFGEKTYAELPEIMRETNAVGRPRTCRELKGGKGGCDWHPPGECHFINAYECSLAVSALSSARRDGQSDFFRGIGGARRFRSAKEKMEFRSALKDVNGIIYFHRYWRDQNKPDAGGSHIDLWRGERQRTKLELFKGEREPRFERVSEEVVFWPV
ncbi:MAG: hypothetical protein JNM89_06455 [Hyphomicrobiaceae bacterium]|nr:hypothetical protein [Hyphomicrobiaceae bacterium]